MKIDRHPLLNLEPEKTNLRRASFSLIETLKYATVFVLGVLVGGYIVSQKQVYTDVVPQKSLIEKATAESIPQNPIKPSNLEEITKHVQTTQQVNLIAKAVEKSVQAEEPVQTVQKQVAQTPTVPETIVPKSDKTLYIDLNNPKDEEEHHVEKNRKRVIPPYFPSAKPVARNSNLVDLTKPLDVMAVGNIGMFNLTVTPYHIVDRADVPIVKESTLERRIFDLVANRVNIRFPLHFATVNKEGKVTRGQVSYTRDSKMQILDDREELATLANGVGRIYDDQVSPGSFEELSQGILTPQDIELIEGPSRTEVTDFDRFAAFLERYETQDGENPVVTKSESGSITIIGDQDKVSSLLRKIGGKSKWLVN